MKGEKAKSLSDFQKASLLSGKNVWQTRAVPSIGLGTIFMSDGPHGLRKQVGSSDHLGLNASQPATCFPTAATIANSWSPELGEEIGKALGAEATEQGVDVILGPGLNIKRSPLCGRNFEYFSEDPILAGRFAAAYVRGIQSQGIAACPKHFAVNSQETRRMTSNSVIDSATLASIYLTAFEIAVKEGAPWVMMSSYNLVNGVYANENKYLLQDILRDSWGFDGMVVTDWGGGNDPVAAINNGGGIEMPSPGFDSASEILRRINGVDRNALDARVHELTELYRRINPHGEVGDHQALAQKAAEESIVLLKNNGVLPLAAGEKVAAIGDFAFHPRYQGSGSSQVNPTELISPIDALDDTELIITGTARGFVPGTGGLSALLSEAEGVAQAANVILLYIGLDEMAESEGRERTTLSLPDNQIELLEALSKTGKKIVAILSGGAPFEMPWIDKCDAIVHGYLGGQAGAPAMARVLIGEINPSGHLAETYPLSLDDTPTAKWYPSQNHHALYKEGPFVGYRYYQSRQKEVLFPFGFGLSYTTFEYSNLVVTDNAATLTVKNTGRIAGADVVQLYVQGNPAIAEPSWELKGFAKVFIQAGESESVTIPFDEYTFRSNVDGNWSVYRGCREIRVAKDAEDPGLRASLFVEGCVPNLMTPDAIHYVIGDVQNVTDAEFSKVLGHGLPAEPDGPLEANSALSEIKNAKSPLARRIYKLYFERGLEKMDKTGKPDLNLLFQFGMPFRAIAKMSGGLASTKMVYSILKIVNGHFFQGIGGVIAGFFGNRRQQKHMQARFEEESK